MFLDRIRHPSPAANPARWLACFCDDCHRAATEAGLDLEAARPRIAHLRATPHGTQALAQALLGPRTSESEPQALEWLSEATQLPLPHSRDELRARGLSPTALAAEIERARAAGIGQLLAGIELVEIKGVSELDQEQIEEGLRAVRMAGANGLVLSWDLWHIPLERLELVTAIWTE